LVFVSNRVLISSSCLVLLFSSSSLSKSALCDSNSTWVLIRLLIDDDDAQHDGEWETGHERAVSRENTSFCTDLPYGAIRLLFNHSRNC
jgi:hypothetical protein